MLPHRKMDFLPCSSTSSSRSAGWRCIVGKNNGRNRTSGLSCACDSRLKAGSELCFFGRKKIGKSPQAVGVVENEEKKEKER